MSQEGIQRDIHRQLQILNELLQNGYSNGSPLSAERRGPLGDYRFTPPLRPVNFGLTGLELPSLGRADRRMTYDGTAAAHIPPSIHSNHSDDNQDDGGFHPLPLLDHPAVQPKNTTGSQGRANSSEEERSFVNAAQTHLEPTRLEEKTLVEYLQTETFKDGADIALQELIKNRDDQGVQSAGTIHELAHFVNESTSWSPTIDVYDIGLDSKANHLDPPLKRQGSDEQPIDAPAVWDMIKDVNINTGPTVGRIIITQEPTAMMLGMLHFALRHHFDMNEIYSHLTTFNRNKGRTTAYMSRAFIADDAELSTQPQAPPHQQLPPPGSPDGLGLATGPTIRHRTFFFVFKYYAVVADGHTSAPWERFDKRPPDRRALDHIDIAESNSILALSLAGPHTRQIGRRQKRKKKLDGFLLDTFAPWYLLNIQSFPDDEHTDRGESTGQEFHNGPLAFLEALVVEYRDAVTRNKILHEKITGLVTPDLDFLFDVKKRDKLLFEDRHFTYIRRYFWAYMTLGVINDSIKSMITAYYSTFDIAFWEGRHPTLWPHPAPDSPAGHEYRTKLLAPLRLDLEHVIWELLQVQERNEKTRREIQSLRDQLFSGSSIMEARRAIEQGDNIRILTLSSMIFLPLTFVTSIFGITEFTIPAEDWRFATTMAGVCVPFIVLLIILGNAGIKMRAKKLGSRVRKLLLKSSDPDAVDSAAANAGNNPLRRRMQQARQVRRRSPGRRAGRGDHHQRDDEGPMATGNVAGRRGVRPFPDDYGDATTTPSAASKSNMTVGAGTGTRDNDDEESRAAWEWFRCGMGRPRPRNADEKV